jgi:type III secretion system YscQ/HrcQ family protein
MSHSPYFLKNLETCLKETLEIPMWGKAPEFPWSAFTEKLKDVFEQPSVSLDCLDADWKNAEDLEEGFASNPLIFSFNLSPLASPFYLLIAPEDVLVLTKVLLDPEGNRTFSDPSYQSGFSHYILLHLLQSFHEISPYDGLKARLCSKPFIKEPAYCVDISASLQHANLLLRLILPETFHRVVTSHFSSKPLPLHRLDSSLEIPLSVQLGKVSLSQKDWLSVNFGDFIFLDECSYHPKTEQGTFFLSIGAQRLFILKRKHHEIKILDYALYNFNPIENEEDLIMDIQDNNNSEDLEFEEHDIAQEEQENPVEPLLSSQEVPLLLLVEVGKITMPLKELLTLKPGNTIPLGHTLDHNVVLTLNTKPVARGQLVQLGSHVGVKISEIAH